MGIDCWERCYRAAEDLASAAAGGVGAGSARGPPCDACVVNSIFDV